MLSTLGAGANGVVYAARQLGLDRTVALKCLPRRAAEDPRARARFRDEARAVSRLRDLHTIAVFDFGETDDGLRFIAMEFAPGGTLADWLEDGPLPPAVVVDVLTQICSSLACAHAAGIVHRDLKPSNVLCSPGSDGAVRVQVADFGVARWTSPTRSEPRPAR